MILTIDGCDRSEQSSDQATIITPEMTQQTWNTLIPDNCDHLLYPVAESEAFPISLKLYIIVEVIDHCTQVGFNLIQGLGRTLSLCEL
jgi:hypothetical protein